MPVIPVLGRQRQVDPWSSLVSQSSLAYLVSSKPERDLEKKQEKQRKEKRIIPEAVYIY